MLPLKFSGAPVLLATGPQGLLVVYGEVVERDLRRAGMSSRRAPPRAGASRRVPLSFALMIAADGQVLRQRDLHLKPNLSVLREERGRTGYERQPLPLVRGYSFIISAACINTPVTTASTFIPDFGGI